MFNLYGYFTNTQRKTNQEVPEGWKWKGAITAENMILKKEFRATKTECSIEMEGWQHKDQIPYGWSKEVPSKNAVLGLANKAFGETDTEVPDGWKGSERKSSGRMQKSNPRKVHEYVRCLVASQALYQTRHIKKTDGRKENSK